MTAVVQFSWNRLEGVGLIAVALGIGLIAQIPPVFFSLALLYLNLQKFLIALIGMVLGASIILAAISCSIAEDWISPDIPTLKSVMSSAILTVLIFLFGFFIFFVLQPLFPPEFTDLDAAQRYFSAMTLGLSLVGILTVLVYKGKSFFGR
ncbi:MAG: hypothetical protein ACFFAJ_01750 [Candidatus Hodarchaeota archaeon]